MIRVKSKDPHQNLAFQAPATHIEGNLEVTLITVETAQTHATIAMPSTKAQPRRRGHTPKTFTLTKAGDGTQKLTTGVATHLLFPDLLGQYRWIVLTSPAH